MLKIAFVINYIVKNGPSSVVLNIINNLDKSRYDISLITLFEGNDKDVVNLLKQKGVHLYECNELTRMKCLLNSTKEFDTIINDNNFDIIHTHGFIPDLISSRLITDAKRITTLHNNMYEDYLDTYGYLKSRIFIKWHQKALKKLDECVCCSKSVYDVMKSHLNNVSFIRNGIEAKSVNALITRRELNIPEDAFIFVYAGVLNTGKNIVWLIDNFVKYHNENEYLLVLGKGEKEKECKEIADDHVRMLGFQSNSIAYMNVSNVYVSASKSEGFSISVLEALSCGLGLFLSDIPSHKEVIEMGEKTYLGETFLQTSFESSLNKLRTNVFKRKDIINLQKNELSAKKMAMDYDKLYCN